MDTGTAGKIIREAREKRRWSQQDLANRVGVSQPAIKKIESGETAQSKHLPKIAQVLDIDLAELVPSLEMDTARKLIIEKLAEKGLSMKEASSRIDRNETYVHQFITRGSPAALGERERERLSKLLGISPDDLRGPNNPLPSRVNGAQSIHSEEHEELRERCRGYERALRKIVAEQPNSNAAEIAKAALRLYE